MTRTERSAFPRSLLKDRSEARNGLNPGLRKNGAGGHNWGRLADERELETAAMADEEYDYGEEDADVDTSSSNSESPTELKKPMFDRTLTEEEIAFAKQFRKNALKGQDIDLSAIARTSAAVSSSPPKADTFSDTASSSSA